MEYGSITWDPYTKQEIAKLESIQRRGARFITKDYKSREEEISPEESKCGTGFFTGVVYMFLPFEVFCYL
jgi:hypothetical protein